ncbi:TolC family protein [Neolewinella antarctica]|uniref:Outer membrane protein n=1 Tax=Neolewinella antarctica TaxID=442734 RepID=A0ABX0XD84_9BACT|nr:TolC family protein [Neolewinella antarctica]NJC27264.1 outer membrane protein [Neolewinella antarctica]
MRFSTFLAFALLSCTGLSAQDASGPWTLERAVDYAFDNNLQVRRLDNTTEIVELQRRQAKNARLPTLDGSTNVGLQLGRTIDPTTNTFLQQTIGFQNYRLQGNVLLYNGGRIKNGLVQAELDLAAAKTDALVTRNNIGLQVANSYLTIVLVQEQLSNARAQLDLVENQLSNTEKLINAGAVASAQRFDLVAQVAANQRTIVELENQVVLGKLSLQILLELDPDDDFDIATPELNPTEEQLFQEYDLQEVMTSARNTQPTIRAAELRQKSAEMELDLAKGGMRPTVSLFGNLNTNYSSVSKDFQNPDDSNLEVVQGPDLPVVINGEPGTIAQFSQSGLIFPNLSYVDQLDRNFGQSVGAVLNVPIYNRGTNKLNVQLAEVQRLNAGLDIEQARNQLRNDVQLALADLRAARQSYRASEVSFEASEAAFENTDRLFRAGATNSLDVVTATNRLDQARTELTRSKFQLIFNRQVIEFYLGRGLTLD